MPYIKAPIDVNQVMMTAFDSLVPADSNARIIKQYGVYMPCCLRLRSLTGFFIR